MTVLNDEARDLFAGPDIAHIATLREAFLVGPAYVLVPAFG